jgi:hypothetical protein
VSETHSDGQSSAGSGNSGSNSSNSGSGPNGSRPGKSASDPVGDLQRWLMKAGARSMANQVADNVRRTLGQQQKRTKGDIWDVATTELPPDEPPECQWCPVCQAARRLRDSGPGLGSKLADAGGVLASVVGDAFSAMEQAMKTPAPAAGSRTQSTTPPARTPATPPPRTPSPPKDAQATGDPQASKDTPAGEDSPASPEGAGQESAE